MKFLKGIIAKRKNFFIFSLMRILIIVFGFANNVLIVRKLNAGDYGVFSIALMLVGLVTTFGFSWSSSSIMYYGSREIASHGNLSRTFWSRNIITFFSLFAVTLLFIIFRNSINAYVGLKLTFLILIWLYVSVAENYLNQYFLAVKRQLLSSVLSITAKAVYLAMILFIPFDVEKLIILNIVSHATVLLYFIFVKKKDIGRFIYDKKWFKEILSFSIWQLFGFSGLYLINFGDTAVIKHFMTLEDVGIYNVAYSLFNVIATLSYTISSYYASSVTAWFSKADTKKLSNFFYKDRLVILLLSVIAHIVVMLCAKTMILMFYGEIYSKAIVLFNILMVGSILRYITVFNMLYLNINKKYAILQFVNIAKAVLNIALDIVLIGYFGLAGPAVATTLAIAATSLFSIIYCEKRIKLACKDHTGIRRQYDSYNEGTETI